MKATKRIALVANDERNAEDTYGRRPWNSDPGNLFRLYLTVVLLQYRAY
ncbi:MAG: hypothetical protein V2I40_13420 [Desulfobacteraceae bacterium]|nr:hypothetical protein [Desulfobacteraceae bacterium]